MKLMNLKILTLLVLIFSMVSCTTTNENEIIDIENSSNTSRLFDPGDDSFDYDEQIIALINYDPKLAEEDVIRVRNSFFSDCDNPMSIGCLDDLKIEMYMELPNLPYTEYWIITRCGDEKEIQCPDGVKDGIEGDEGIGNVG